MKSTTKRKLELDRQTLRQLTTTDLTKVVGGRGSGGSEDCGTLSDPHTGCVR